MSRQCHSLFLVLFSALLCSCGTKAPTQEELNAQVPPQLRAGGPSNSTVQLEQVGNYQVDARAREAYENSISATRADDIVFTKPGDNERTVAAELKEIFKREYSGPWLTSYKEATRLAQKEKRPLLIVFINSKGTQLERALSTEVFGANEFGEWAAGKVIRLEFDEAVTGNSDEKIRKQKYITQMKEKYKVQGSPYAVLQLPDGSVVSRYRGYKQGNQDFYFGRLQNDVKLHQKSIDAWTSDMERKGYRMWTNRKGRTIFAKPTGFKQSRVSLVEPDGRKSQVHISDLSDDDKTFIQSKVDAFKQGRS